MWLEPVKILEIAHDDHRAPPAIPLTLHHNQGLAVGCVRMTPSPGRVLE
jgi:hypothetical protein